jgi:hypothetical protein
VGVSGLLEAVASIAITTVVFATLTGALGSTAVTSLAAWGLVHQMSEERHAEHLLDTTLARTRGAAGRIVDCGPAGVTFEADLDANGSIDTASSETTSFAIVNRAGGVRALTQRLGNQSITLTDRLAAGDAIVCADSLGAATTDPTAVRVVEVPVARRSSRALDAR